MPPRQLARDGQCMRWRADLADRRGPAKLAAAFARHESALHVLVNNAGASEQRHHRHAVHRGLGHGDGREPARTVLPRAAAAAATARRGHARRTRRASSTSVPSAALHIPNWEAFPYGASKAAIHHLTRALAKRLGREHIIANAIAPGPFPSRLTDTDIRHREEERRRPTCPLGRAGEPQDIEGPGGVPRLARLALRQRPDHSAGWRLHRGAVGTMNSSTTPTRT